MQDDNMASIGGRACFSCMKFQVLRTRIPPLMVHPEIRPVMAMLSLQCRYSSNKHYVPKWRKLRAAKVLKINLPDYTKMKRDANKTPDEMRSEMKKKGQLPPRNFSERNIVIASTNSIFEPYVPPEGDGVASVITTEGAKQRMTELEKKGKSLMQARQIKKYDPDFATKQFAELALNIYTEAQELLTDLKKNEDRLHELVTERAYPEMTWRLDKKTFRWKYVEALEPPRVVHVRTTEMMSKDNKYAQVTVRLHTKQTMAIYDRFGRLMYGSENLIKDVLEYVVFEKHLADEYGTWRIHGKVIPDWMSERQPVLRTMCKPHFDPVEETEAGEKGGETATATA